MGAAKEAFHKEIKRIENASNTRLLEIYEQYDALAVKREEIIAIKTEEKQTFQKKCADELQKKEEKYSKK